MPTVRFSDMDPTIEELISLVRHKARQLHRLLDKASRSDLENTEKERLWAEAKNLTEELGYYENQIETWLQLDRKLKRRVKKHGGLAATEMLDFMKYRERYVGGEVDGTSSSSSSSYLRPGFRRSMGDNQLGCFGRNNEVSDVPNGVAEVDNQLVRIGRNINEVSNAPNGVAQMNEYDPQLAAREDHYLWNMAAAVMVVVLELHFLYWFILRSVNYFIQT